MYLQPTHTHRISHERSGGCSRHRYSCTYNLHTLTESVTNAVEDVQDIVTDVFAERIDFSVLSVYMAPEEPVKVDDDEPEPAAAVVEEEKVK